MSALFGLDEASLHSLIASYGYPLIVLIVACESAGLPLPGETVLISAAVFAGTTHQLEIGGVIAAAACGAILGDNVGFWIGRESGPAVVSRFGPTLGLDERRQKLGRYLFLRYGGAIVFFGRFVALLRAFAALLAGMNGLSPARFMAFNAAGGIVWASLFGLGGYYAGKSVHAVSGPVGKALLILATIGLFLLWRFYKRHEESLLQRAEQAMNESSATAST